MGIKGVIMDLDNTLVPWKDCAVFPEIMEWMGKLHEYGFKYCIVSNNNSRRGEELPELAGVPAFWKAVKPRRKTLRKALELMSLKPSQVAVIGDQIFTDILGGNRLGLYTILVSPLDRQEFVGTKLVRKLERVVLFGLSRMGYLK